MNDEWRLRVDLHEEGAAHRLTDQLEARELEHDLEVAFHDRVIVSRDGPEVFCYAGTRQQAEAAERAITSLAAQEGWHLSTELKHWHPTAEDWEDPDKPLPESDAQRLAEHAARTERERAEVQQAGHPEWEVRVQCASHHDALELSEKLRDEGMPHLHRWKYLLVGATDEESAEELAAQIEREAPSGTSTTVEGTVYAARAALPRNPFAVLGGLGV